MTVSRVRATGVIKKVFFQKPEPFGFLQLLKPLSLRGEEAVFYLEDMLLRPFDKELLQQGMMMECFVNDQPDDVTQSFVRLRARELEPLDPAEYTAVVIRSVDPRPCGQGLLVCTDLCLMRVSITPDSYAALELETSPLPGDKCIVRISWREMLETSLNSGQPTAELVKVMPQEPGLPRQRSSSREELSVESRSSSAPEKNANARNEKSTCSHGAASTSSFPQPGSAGHGTASSMTAVNRFHPLDILCRRGLSLLQLLNCGAAPSEHV